MKTFEQQELKFKLINRINQAEAIGDAMSFDLPSEIFRSMNKSKHDLIQTIIDDSKKLDDANDFLEINNEVHRVIGQDVKETF